MNSKLVKWTTMALMATAFGTTAVVNNAKADDSNVETSTIQVSSVTDNYSQSQQVLNQVTSQANTQVVTASSTANSNVTNPQNAQTINYPANYNLNTLRNINDDASANSFSDQVSKAGMVSNNYESNAQAAQEQVDINNLTDAQVTEINEYALGLVNNARASFGESPFIQNQGTINAVKNMALQYQAKNESLLTGSWHDESILNGKSENISAMQVYEDDTPGLAYRSFVQAKGSDFLYPNNVPLFKVTTMDDLRAMVFYGVTTMLFNDASDDYGHAQNFLTNYQPIMAMAVYPSVLSDYGTGQIANGTTFKFKLADVDMHFIWAEGTNSSNNDSSDDTSVTHADGFTKVSDGQYVYYQDGQLVHGEKQINGNWYYFAPTSGEMAVGFTKLPDGRTVYYNDQGQMVKGEKQINGSWYYFAQNNGDMAKGFTKLPDGRTIYYDNQGRMVKGEKQINGNWYYFAQNNGDMAKGFTKLPDGRTIYYDDQGRMVKGEKQINGNWYYFAQNNGDMAKGFTKLPDGRTIYYDNQGRMVKGEKQINGSWYYFAQNNGNMAKGFTKLPDGRTVYYDNQGRMVHGDYVINGRTYHFNQNNGALS